MKEININLYDTALGRHGVTMKRNPFTSVTTMATDEQEELQRKIESCNKTSPPQVQRRTPPPSKLKANPSGVDGIGGAMKDNDSFRISSRTF